MQQHRAQPFSGSRKKAQLQEKRQRQRDKAARSTTNITAATLLLRHLLSGRQPAQQAVTTHATVRSTSKDTAATSYGDPHHPAHHTVSMGSRLERGLESVFVGLAPDPMLAMKAASQAPIVPVSQASMEIGFDDMYPSGSLIDFPKRPPWSTTESQQELDTREHNYMESWSGDNYGALWRFRKSKPNGIDGILSGDVVLFIVDARHPILHFPPTLYDYIVHEMHRKLVLVLNKNRYPEIKVVEFSCYSRDEFLEQGNTTHVNPLCAALWGKNEEFINGFPGDSIWGVCKSMACFCFYNAYVMIGRDVDSGMSGSGKVFKRYRKRYAHAVGALQVIDACRSVKLEKEGVNVDWDALFCQMQADISDRDQRQLASRSRKNEAESFWDDPGDDSRLLDDNDDNDDDDIDGEKYAQDGIDAIGISDDESPQHNLITIGLAGHPNVGKSSLINGVMGHKVVSTSKTPGHTKHFQTMHLTKFIRLCDCPG
ncbi:hypothetical protein BSLG_004899 [Batrachochytrium salamandrivorans]|nr:hypothetical protein BSLG_004899 [Batrachochytrium salamandrivorans]